jgi:hypothetical protein
MGLTREQKILVAVYAIGALLVTAGAALVYLPAGLVAAGALTIAGLFVDIGGDS